MHRVVIFIGHYPQTSQLPIQFVQHGLTYLFWFDHAHTPAERQAAVRTVLAPCDIDQLDVVVTDCPRGCHLGEHVWMPVMEGDQSVAAECAVCGAHEPFWALFPPMRVVRAVEPV